MSGELVLTKKERLRAFFERRWHWIRKNFGETTPALHGLALAVTALIFSITWAESYWPTPLGYGLAFAVLLGGLILASWLAGKLLGKLLGRSFRCLITAGVLGFSLYELLRRGAAEGHTFRVAAFTCAVFAALWLFTASLWRLLRHRRWNAATVGAAFVSGAACAGVVLLFFSEGFPDHYVSKYLALNPTPHAAVSALEPSLAMGPYTVSVLDYGTEEGLPSDTVNLTTYLNRDNADWDGFYADLYLDYDLNKVPMVGRVWYPADGTNCPVLFIAHGNHEITVDSYLGYDYLGEYLASHGYVVVSVDHNACNLMVGENDGRAVLLLRHIGQILEYGKDPENPLFGKLDADNLSIAGHSRGGEMVATAYLFNGYDRYPENGAVKFNFGYPIKSIIAIAPTVNQYKPADHSVELEDVNYLLIHGACDRDVKNFMGMTQYENITFSGEEDGIKSALYIAGANHSRFNSLWGDYDQSLPFGSLLNTRSIMSREEQEWITGVMVKVFLDVTLKGDTSCRSLLTDWDDYAGQLPQMVYFQCSETADFLPVADFEEDSDLETVTMEGVSAVATGTAIWTEELMDFSNDTSFDTYALRLRWHNRATYALTMPETDVSGSELTFDIADLHDDAVERGEYALVDGTVELTDAAGAKAEARIRDYATIFPVLPVRTDKLDYIFDDETYRHAFSTVTIPVAAFAAEEGFDSALVTEVRFRFEGGGEIAMDNIGFNRLQTK